MLIHDARKINKPKRKFNIYLFYLNNRKSIKKIFIILIFLFIILFPVFSGTIIGNWIKDFFGTIIHIISQI